ncbi:MAG: ATP-binding protein, partial [Thermoanaerobaculia bacterium]
MRQGFRESVGAHPGELERVNAVFARFAEKFGIPAGVRRSVTVALDELLANELSHGMAGRDAGSVTVEVKLDQERVTVTITNDGPHFDPFEQEAPDTTLPVDE